jgi:hypothetical protein
LLSVSKIQDLNRRIIHTEAEKVQSVGLFSLQTTFHWTSPIDYVKESVFPRKA